METPSRGFQSPKMRTPSEESGLLHRIGFINLFLLDNFLCAFSSGSQSQVGIEHLEVSNKSVEYSKH